MFQRIPFAFMICFSFFGSLAGETYVEVCMENFRNFLEEGTYQNKDFSRQHHIPKSRYETFKHAFQSFIDHNGHLVVELGAPEGYSRNTSSAIEKNDINKWTPDIPRNWDWNCGCFSLVANAVLSILSPEIHVVDSDFENIERCQVMAQEYDELMTYHQSNSEDFLLNCDFPQGIDLLYMNHDESSYSTRSKLLHLREAKFLVHYNLIAPGGLILINDVNNGQNGKEGIANQYGNYQYCIPYLLNNGFEMVMDEYQVLLRKI